MIYLWYPQGRLGNLIFQYQAIANLSGEHRVLALANDFFDLFESHRRFLVLPVPKRLRWRMQHQWTRFLDFLQRRRLVGSIEPTVRIIEGETTSETLETQHTRGRVSGVVIVKGFFQSQKYLLPLPRIHARAIAVVDKLIGDIARDARVAIHMRFGDYATWPVFGVPGIAELPATYYLAAIETVRAAVPHATFVVISDEPARAETILRGHVDNVRFVEGTDATTDFTLIASCAHAILSASSYSWWAAVLITGREALLIAPKYWLGFRKRVWYPAEIACDRFTYIEFAGP